MFRFALLLLLSLGLSSQAVAGSFNSEFHIINDFSQRIYKDGTTYNKTGPYPKAATIEKSTLKVTLKSGMTDKHTKTTGRYELEKANIDQGLAVYQKFKIRSGDNLINDRVLVSQIKYMKKNSSGLYPNASVYLDRAPVCVTWHQSRNDSPEANGVIFGPHMYANQTQSIWQFSWRENYPVNQPFISLADGKWHTVEMDVFPHEKDGYCIIKIDGKVWVALNNAPTKQHFGEAHSDYAARIGVYRDDVKHSHTVYFDDWEVKSYKPIYGSYLSYKKEDFIHVNLFSGSDEKRKLISIAKNAIKKKSQFRECLINEGIKETSINVARFRPVTKEASITIDIILASKCFKRLEK